MAAEPKVGVMLRLPQEVYERARNEAASLGLTLTAYTIAALVEKAGPERGKKDARKEAVDWLHS